MQQLQDFQQLPSGIVLFFALSLFAAAVIIFFGAGEGISPLSVVLALVLAALGVAFVWTMLV